MHTYTVEYNPETQHVIASFAGLRDKNDTGVFVFAVDVLRQLQPAARREAVIHHLCIAPFPLDWPHSLIDAILAFVPA